MKKCLLFTFLSVPVSLFAQSNAAFQAAYTSYPEIPKGILESVAWCNTRMHHLTENEQSSCIEIPQARGVMGLFDDGKNYFYENAKTVSVLAGMDLQSILQHPDLQIMAYASAFATKYRNYYTNTQSEEKALYNTLDYFSEIPDTGFVNYFALQSQIYQYLNMMKDESFAATYGFQAKNYDLKELFGETNYKVLSSPMVIMSSQAIKSVDGIAFQNAPTILSTDYGPALWAAAPTCNFSSRSGTAISAITIHTIQGSYAGAISWSQNCASNVSFHYVIRSSDGQITQMVLESNKAWHVGSENPYTIGYEHEGWVNQTGWYTEAMYQSSAALTRNICSKSYGIPPLRTYHGMATSGVKVLGGCTKIKGHQHYPNQTHTDPGINWDWEKYYKLINNAPAITSITASSGNFYDSGGPSGNYTNDERKLWLIQPSGAATVTLNFTQFDIENDWDFLLIYDGATTNAPLIGKYTGTASPGTVIGTNGALLVEFRSDCATVKSGWAATYTSTISSPIVPPVTSITDVGNWKTSNFTALFSDVSTSSTIQETYYLVADRQDASEDWLSQGNQGFANAEFNFGNAGWTSHSGTFTRTGNKIVCNDESNSNTNYSRSVTQNIYWKYLYHFKMKMQGALANQRAGLHFFNSDATQTNRGNSYFVYLRTNTDKVQIYKVTSNTYTLQTDDSFTIDPNVEYDVKITYDPSTGWIKVYVDGVLASSWQDSSPLTSGNSISLRSAETKVEYDDVRVYRNRSSSVAVTVGTGQQMRYESTSSVPTGRIYAISRDNNFWSNVAVKDYFIDYTPPSITLLENGTGPMVKDTIYEPIISAFWNVEDLQSSIDNIEFAIGETPMGEEVQTWMSVLPNQESVVQMIDSLRINETYYVKLRVTNGAGLTAEAATKGQFYTTKEEISVEENVWSKLQVYPNPTSDYVSINGLLENTTVYLYDIQGKLLQVHANINDNYLLQFANLPSGVYLLILQHKEQMILRKIVRR